MSIIAAAIIFFSADRTYHYIAEHILSPLHYLSARHEMSAAAARAETLIHIVALRAMI
jgi:hypothetical protein